MNPRLLRQGARRVVAGRLRRHPLSGLASPAEAVVEAPLKGDIGPNHAVHPTRSAMSAPASSPRPALRGRYARRPRGGSGEARRFSKYARAARTPREDTRPGQFWRKRGRLRTAPPAQYSRPDALSRIQNRVGDHGDRLDRWMQVEVGLASVSPENVGAGVIPDVGPISAESAELNVVAMRFPAIAKDENQLMPRTIKRAHAAVGRQFDSRVRQSSAHRLATVAVTLRLRCLPQSRSAPHLL
jgi:hypothetical protein